MIKIALFLILLSTTYICSASTIPFEIDYTILEVEPILDFVTYVFPITFDTSNYPNKPIMVSLTNTPMELGVTFDSNVINFRISCQTTTGTLMALEEHSGYIRKNIERIPTLGAWVWFPPSDFNQIIKEKKFTGCNIVALFEK